MRDLRSEEIGTVLLFLLFFVAVLFWLAGMFECRMDRIERAQKRLEATHNLP